MGGRFHGPDDRRGALVTPSQGEIWWGQAEDKRRPVLVVTRSEAVPVLTWLIVAPVTRTIRDIPTEVALGPEEGLPSPCVASFDNLQPIRRSFLTEQVGRLDLPRAAICGALRALADC
jgi:mRNA interferase MazF